MTLEELTEAFRSLGADDPESWAHSQVKEGIPQLHTYAFLKQAWEGVVDTGSSIWLNNMLLSKGPHKEALERLLALGADPADLTAIVRDMQIDMFFSLCFLLGCPDPIEINGKSLEWRLFVTDEEQNPIEELWGLHESVITSDPELRR